MGTARPTVIRNPATDAAFETTVSDLLDTGLLESDVFEARLREVYPNATVHQRELDGEGILTWYAYRDGSWTRGT